MERLVPTWRLLRDMPVDSEAPVSLGRVLKHRLALLEVDVRALRYAELDPLLHEAVEIAADGVGAPIGKILTRQADGNLRIAAGAGLMPGVVGGVEIEGDATTPASECLSKQGIVYVRDVRSAEGYQLPRTVFEHGVVSTIAVPILVESGPFGVLQVDTAEPRDFDALDRSFLIGIAGTIGEGVERLRREERLTRAVDAREALLREHHHRVRNSYQTLIGVLGRHARAAGSPDSRERFGDVERRLFALASLYDHLVGVAHARAIGLEDYLATLCESLREFHGFDQERNISLGFRRTEELLVGVDAATAIGIIVNELVANSVEHAFGPKGGTITVAVLREPDGSACISVADSGVGYRPSAEDSVGLATMRRLASQIDAHVSVESNGGTTWTIRVPARHMTVLNAFAGSKPLLKRLPRKSAERT